MCCQRLTHCSVCRYWYSPGPVCPVCCARAEMLRAIRAADLRDVILTAAVVAGAGLALFAGVVATALVCAR